MPLTGGIFGFGGGFGVVDPPAPEADTPPAAPLSGGATTPTQAITDFWNARADISSLFPGGMWAGEAPDTVDVMPYAVIVEVSAVVEDYTTGPSLSRGMYQISCLADTLAVAQSLAESVRAGFNRATLSVEGLDIMLCLSGEPRWTLAKGLGVDGRDCWMCYVEIEILWSR